MNFKWLLLSVILVYSCKNVENNKEMITKGVQVNPSIKVLDYSGLAPLLAKENDTTYVVNFWATWCKPCINELPAFEKLRENYSNEKVKVLLVSLDFPDKLETQVIPYVRKHLKSEVILLDDADANNWIPKISKKWSGAIPATIIYKNKNRIFYEQSFNYAQLEKEVTLIL